MKILLFGKQGQLGWELQRSLTPLGSVVALDRQSPDLCGDLTDSAGLARTIQTVKPDVIVNAAAYTAVDRAQTEPQLARQVNTTAVGVMATEAQALGAWLVHYSTDYVFDGSGDLPWTEADTCAPLNEYGQTKWQGELLIQAVCAKHLIFRTSWVYGSRGGNFAKTMLRLAQERTRMTVVADQFGAPTGADLLADVSAHALLQAVAKPQLAGLYHIAAAGVTTWFDYAKYVFDQSQSAQAAIKIIVNEWVPVTSGEFPTAATRPLNSRLATARLRNAFGLSLPPWEHGVARLVQQLATKPGA
jgi:dTDP-4-dehydrorhamnose reductase